MSLRVLHRVFDCPDVRLAILSKCFVDIEESGSEVWWIYTHEFDRKVVRCAWPLTYFQVVELGEKQESSILKHASVEKSMSAQCVVTVGRIAYVSSKKNSIATSELCWVSADEVGSECT